MAIRHIAGLAVLKDEFMEIRHIAGLSVAVLLAKLLSLLTDLRSCCVNALRLPANSEWRIWFNTLCTL